MFIDNTFIMDNGPDKIFKVIGLDMRSLIEYNYIRLIVKCNCCGSIRDVKLEVGKRRTLICKGCGKRRYVSISYLRNGIVNICIEKRERKNDL